MEETTSEIVKTESDALQEANIKICQTETMVLVSILEPGLSKSEVDVLIEPRFFRVNIDRVDIENPVMSGTLFGAVEKDHCRVRVKPESVVIKLRKTTTGRWKSILQDATTDASQANSQTMMQQENVEQRESIDPEPMGATSPLASISHKPPCFFARATEDPSVIDCSKMGDDDQYSQSKDDAEEEREPEAGFPSLADAIRERAAAEAVKEIERKVSILKNQNEEAVAALAEDQSNDEYCDDPTEEIDDEKVETEVKWPKLSPKLMKHKRRQAGKDKPRSRVKVSPGVNAQGGENKVKGMMDAINVFFNPAGFLNPACGRPACGRPGREISDEADLATRSFQSKSEDNDTSDDPWSEEETVTDYDDEKNDLSGPFMKRAEAMLGDME